MFRTKIGSLAISLSLLTLPVIPSFIAAADEIEEVVAVGTRRDARSVGDSPAPVDVISAADDALLTAGDDFGFSETTSYYE